jgi:hypothetical protein
VAHGHSRASFTRNKEKAGNVSLKAIIIIQKNNVPDDYKDDDLAISLIYTVKCYHACSSKQLPVPLGVH